MSVRAERVLTNDPAMGIFRHADAGYPDAIDNAKNWKVDIPKIICHLILNFITLGVCLF